MKKGLTVILFFFLLSCGYQPIYLNNKSKNLEFLKINFVGDEKINRKILNTLNISTNLNSKDITEQLYLTSNYIVYETSKDSKGLILSYRSEISVNYVVKIKDKIIKQKKLKKNFDYNNFDNKFELVKYQNEVKNNLIDKVIEEIKLFIDIE